MKKNILLLINGFGIEKADSYNVYSSALMPNLDSIRVSKDKVFISIPNKYLDYKEAYRNFSIGIEDSLTYNLVESNIYNNEFKENQLFRYVVNEVNKNKTKLHFIVYWDSNKTVDNLIYYLREMDKQVKTNIYVHIILCQKSLNDYKEIERGLNALSYEAGTKVKIGIVTGESNFTDPIQVKEIVKTFITEFGEKWKDLPKKINVSKETNIVPRNVRTFAVNIGFKLEENDQLFFYNFSNVDISTFKKEMEAEKFRPIKFDTIRYYSLFPIKCDQLQVPFMYNYAIASNCFMNSIKSINAKALVLDKKENCSYINYFLTGLRNTIDDSIKYSPIENSFFDNPESIIETIKKYDYDLYILNYDISYCNKLEELKNSLSKIDGVIGKLNKYCTDNKYGLFISSLYGIEKYVYNEKLEKCKINFSGRAPVFISDSDINLSKYSQVEPGSLYDLSNTILWNINKEYNTPGLLKKKSALLSFLYKKPKEESKK